jgi:Ca2+-binding RTX toxin-like protein
MANDLKPFVINGTDIKFLLDQVSFIPLFDVSGNALINWDGTGSVYDGYGKIIWDATTQTGNYNNTVLTSANYLGFLGGSYQNITDLAGLRDPSGFNNNLTLSHANWGQANQLFPRMATADFTKYSQEVIAAADLGFSTPSVVTTAGVGVRINNVISSGSSTSSNTSGGVTVAKAIAEEVGTAKIVSTDSTVSTSVKDGHHTAFTVTQTETSNVDTTSIFLYDNVTTTTTISSGAISATSTNTQTTQTTPVVTTGLSTLVSSTSTLSGGELNTDMILFKSDGKMHNAHSFGTVTNGVLTAAEYSNPNASVVDYTPRMISRATTTAGVTYDTWANHQNLTAPISVYDNLGVVVANWDGVGTVFTDTLQLHPVIGGTVAGDIASLAALAFLIANPAAAHHGDNEIYYGDNNTGVAQVLSWGDLETVANGGMGQVDTQARFAGSAGEGEKFIGGLNPGVSPSNGFFVLFGQFFDHGLDFIDKGGQGSTIKIALAIDDPLYGMIGPDGMPVTSITIARATLATTDAQGPEYVNHTSPFIDQSQTYGSSSQLTTLLREWVLDPSTSDTTDYHAGMKLLDGITLAKAWKGADGVDRKDTLPTLNELRAHIEATGRDGLTWEDVSNLRNRDASGDVIAAGQPGAGTSGSALILDSNPRFDEGHLHNGTHAQDLVLDAAIATINASFGTALNAPHLSLATGGVLTLTGYVPGPPLTGASALYPFVNFTNFSITAPAGAVHAAVGEILMASVGDHYIAGDGRVNENFGLTSIHHIFHEEHNYQVQNFIDAMHRSAEVSGNYDNLHSFQVNTGIVDPMTHDYKYADGSIAWDQDKMFNASKLIVEMEYQHAAVDQYARNVTPNIQEFVGYTPEKNPGVTLEYAQGAFRFGHSTLRETIDTIDPTHGLTGKIMGFALRDAFLNPDKYAEVGPAAVLLGMSHQQMNEVDEFITPALNQGLLGQALDLGAINIARGRDIGLPTLNDFREAIGLARYTSWTDFGQNMQHASSLGNFIAAYSFDGDMAKAEAILALASGSYVDPLATAAANQAAGLALAGTLGYAHATATDLTAAGKLANAFLSGQEATVGDGALGFNHIDTWLGGLAEIHQPGGLLGETFDKVFVTQIEALMDGDRFYYLYRLAGQQFAEEVGNGQLKDIVERNTGLNHLNGNVFGYADQYVDLGATVDTVNATGNEHKYGGKLAVAAGTMGIYTNGGLGNSNDGGTITIGGVTYVQDTRLADSTPGSLYDQNGGVNLDGTPNSGAESSEVIVGSKGNDLIYAQGGDDTVYGGDGNDTIYGGFGIDRLYGGNGADTIYGGDNPDLMDGGSGDDKLYGESSGSDINGNDQVIGGSGNDFISGGTGIDKLSGGTGDDHIMGDQDTDPFTHGSDGNDLVEGNSGGDILYGDNGDDVLDGGADQDQMFGGNGDDIIRPGDTTGALTIGTDEVLGGDGVTDEGNTPGTIGFDIVDFSDNAVRLGGVDFDLGLQQNPAVNVNGIPKQIAAFQLEGVIGSAGNDTITGNDNDATQGAVVLGDNWLIGGSGNDLLTGNGGNDIIIGGSIRLDALIGSYNSGYTHNNANDGSTEALQLQDARYQGASHRVLYSETIDTTGIIDAVNATIAGTNNDFQKHFTEMLRSDQFKDMVLGDGGVDGTADVAAYSGRLSQYTLTAVNAAGQVVTDVHQNWASIVAFKVADNRTANDLLDNNGDPILDANGNPITLDGTDMIIGVENLKFADQTINLAVYFDKAPAVDLNFAPASTTVASDGFTGGGNAYGRGTGWGGNWSESGDNNNSGSGQILVDTAGAGVTNNGLHITGGTPAGSFNGASISRAVNLSTDLAATLNFSVQQLGLGAGETVKVYLLGATPTVSDVPLYTIQTGTDASATTHTIPLTGPFPAGARLYFVSSAMDATTDDVYIDNISITAVRDTDVSGITVGYTELQALPVVLTTTPHVSDPDDTLIYSATVHAREAVAGDQLTLSGAFAGIIATGDGTGNLVLTSALGATFAQFESALQAVRFANSGNNPTNYGANLTRHLDVTVNDGLRDSAVATTLVNITAVNDPAVTGADNVITNIAVGTGAANNIVIPDWALLANDSDPDTVLTISAIAGGTGGIVTTGNGAGHSGTTTTVRDSTAGGGTFTYTVNGVTGNANLAAQQSGTALIGTAANEILIGNDATITINGGDGNDIIFGNGGSDALSGGTGDDTISYTVTTSGGQNPTITSGRDFIDGGTTTVDVNNRDSGSDTFILNGATGGETFKIMTRAEALLHLSSADILLLNANTEIVITRQTGNGVSATNFANMVVLAELDNIEEIRVNTLAVTANNANGGLDGVTGTGNGDTVQILGAFGTTTNATTSLNFSTITINGGADDKVDITGLTSDHRIVFNGATNPNQIIGDLRPQDVVNYGNAGSGGTDTSGSGTGTDGTPTGDQGGETEVHHTHSDDGMGPGQHGTPPSGGTGGTTPAPTAPVAPVDQNLLGDATANVLAGGDGNNTIAGLAGEDLISSGNGNNNVIAGDGADTIVLGNGNNHVDAGLGADNLFLGNGTNWVNAGAGDDTVFGGTGNTTFVDNGNDGSDTYHGGGASDTLDMSAISARIEANLGTGYAGWAKVGTETNHLYGIENIATGSGDDTITASDAHNTIDVGDHSAAGHDTVIFRTAASADGDNILNFQTGDKIDLHNMMNGTINLVSTAASAHDVAVQFDATTHGDSIITGIDEGGNHFTIDVKGHHVIGTDFAA